MVESFKEYILKKSNSYNSYKSEYNRLKKEKSISDNLNSNFLEVSRKLKDIENEINSVSGSLSGRVDVVSGRLDELDKSVVDGFNELNSVNCGFRDSLDELSNDIDSILSKCDGHVTQINDTLEDFNKKINLFTEKLRLVENSLNNIFLLLNEFGDFQKVIDTKANNIKEEVYRNQRFVREVQYSNVFKDTINDSEWLINKSFSPNNSASNYSFLYILYRVLNEVRPKNILELGLGQTTKMTSQYAAYFKNSNLIVIEDNKRWIETFSNVINLTNNMKLCHVDKEKVSIDSSVCLKYENFDNFLDKKLFDFVIIDGPIGYNQKYPRSNIWDLLNYLNKEFIIIFDDYERIGEQNTCKRLFNLLESRNIRYNKTIFKGLKDQLLIYTKNYEFVGWF